MIGSKFSCHFFNQSEVKPKPIVAHVCTFSHALCWLRVLLRVLIGLLDCLHPFWLAKVITLVLVLRHSFENHSKLIFGLPNYCSACTCTWLNNLNDTGTWNIIRLYHSYWYYFNCKGLNVFHCIFSWQAWHIAFCHHSAIPALLNSSLITSTKKI